MNYPFWDVDIGYGLIIAAVAIIHVFVSHFAIGGGLYLVVTETLARKKENIVKLAFLEKLTKFFVLVSVVFGALTGVGIWFVIGLLNPAATEALIHNFVWGWAIEWTFFAIEITAALVYFYGWKKLSARNHIIVGWIYFASAFMSLVVINGIVAFMLTPGDWLATGDFWDGFFNPTYWSSLFLRTGVCIMLAGIYALLVASREKADADKGRLVRYNSVWAIVGLLITMVFFGVYLNDIPKDIMDAALSSNLTAVNALNASYINAGLIILFVVFFGFIIPRRYSLIVGILVMIFALSWFGEYEWIRESLRKPYVIYDYMYGNSLEVSKTSEYEKSGYLAQMKFRRCDDGADLFRHACRSCHTIDCYKALRKTYDGLDEEFIAQSIRGVHVMRGKMPPFLGTDEEVRMLAAHIYSKVDNRHLSEIYNLEGVELGGKVYDVRCGNCHVIGGYNDKSESLIGLEREDYEGILEMAGDFADEMPDFTGDEKEKEALIEFLMSLEEGGQK